MNDMLDNFINEDTLKIISSKTSDEITNYPKWVKIIHKLINNIIDPMDLHFKYTVNGIGFEDAKKDFFKNLSTGSES